MTRKLSSSSPSPQALVYLLYWYKRTLSLLQRVTTTRKLSSSSPSPQALFVRLYDSKGTICTFAPQVVQQVKQVKPQRSVIQCDYDRIPQALFVFLYRSKASKAYLLYWYKSTNTNAARLRAAEIVNLIRQYARGTHVLSLLALLVRKYKH
jgi:hypothetical protein